jgi:hypothetical protein
MLDNLTTNELVSNISYLCELSSAANVIKYESKLDLTKQDSISLLPVLIQYRDALVSRISDAETVMERSTLTQLYYRFLGVIRNLKNYVTYLDDFKELSKLNSNITLDIKTSYSQLENVNLAGSQLDNTED